MVGTELFFIEAAFALLAGACVGSFVTMASHRLPLGLDIVFKPSHCTVCNATLKGIDLIPILSWCVMGGNCRHCKASVSARYPVIEIITAILFLLVYLEKGITVEGGIFALLVTTLMILTVTDFEHRIIPDTTQVAIVILAITYHYVHDTDAMQVALGGFAGLMVGLSLRYGYLWIRKLDALGLGDVKFLLGAGLWLTSKPLVLMLLFSGIMGTILGLFWRAVFKTQRFPFAPALALSLLILTLYADRLKTITELDPFYIDATLQQQNMMEG